MSADRKERALGEFKKIVESGLLGPVLHPSLIGIPQDEFEVSWPEPKARYFLPSELTAYSYNGIDAYAAALLATDTLFAPDCMMTVSCEFRKDGDESLDLVFSSITDILTPELYGDRIVQFLNGFVPALTAKGINPDSGIFCNKVGAPAWFRFPGKMLLKESVLAGIPETHWPTAKRKFAVSGEIRASARNAIRLLTTPDSQMYRYPV